MTTTADSATITAQDRSQGRLEPVHAMNEAANHEGPKRSCLGDLQASEPTARDSRTGNAG